MHAHAITLQATPHAHPDSIQQNIDSIHQYRFLHSEELPQYAHKALLTRRGNFWIRRNASETSASP